MSTTVNQRTQMFKRWSAFNLSWPVCSLLWVIVAALAMILLSVIWPKPYVFRISQTDVIYGYDYGWEETNDEFRRVHLDTGFSNGAAYERMRYFSCLLAGVLGGALAHCVRCLIRVHDLAMVGVLLQIFGILLAAFGAASYIPKFFDPVYGDFFEFPWWSWDTMRVVVPVFFVLQSIYLFARWHSRRIGWDPQPAKAYGLERFVDRIVKRKWARSRRSTLPDLLIVLQIFWIIAFPMLALVWVILADENRSAFIPDGSTAREVILWGNALAFGYGAPVALFIGWASYIRSNDSRLLFASLCLPYVHCLAMVALGIVALAFIGLISVMKNLSIMGALLFIIANGSGPMSLDDKLAGRGDAMSGS